jgi:hypothetical protein
MLVSNVLSNITSWPTTYPNLGRKNVGLPWQVTSNDWLCNPCLSSHPTHRWKLPKAEPLCEIALSIKLSQREIRKDNTNNYNRDQSNNYYNRDHNNNYYNRDNSNNNRDNSAGRSNNSRDNRVGRNTNTNSGTNYNNNSRENSIGRNNNNNDNNVDNNTRSQSYFDNVIKQNRSKFDIDADTICTAVIIPVLTEYPNDSVSLPKQMTTTTATATRMLPNPLTSSKITEEGATANQKPAQTQEIE